MRFYRPAILNAYPRDTSRQEADRLWMQIPRGTFAVEIDGQIVSTYYIEINQHGPGSQVCNCGYMVFSLARGKGIASALCEHSQRVAVELDYRAMQFNFVASTNDGAIRL